MTRNSHAVAGDAVDSTMACPACGAGQWVAVSGTHGGQYYRCSGCRYHVRAHQSEQPRTEHFEQEQQRFYGDNSFCMTQLFSQLQANRVRNRIKLLTRYLSTGRLIEVGPGNGEVLARLTKVGYQCVGVEHSATLADLIRRRYDIDIRTGAFEDQDFSNDTFDAFLSFHVIEHVTDVVEHLRQAARVVRPDGYGFIATPNADSWEHRVSGHLSPNYSPVHLQLFSRESMRRLLEKSGWQLEAVHTPCYTDAWLRVVSSFTRRLRGKTGGSGETVMRNDTPFRRRVIQTLGIIDLPWRSLQRMFRAGNELFVVARRVG